MAQTINAGADFINPVECGANALDFQFVAADNGYVLLSNGVSKVKDRKVTKSLEVSNHQFVALHFTDENHGWAISSSVNGTVFRYVK